ncbi:MAG: hypothetical protein CVV64_02595 [Candidatus Wallbacteria bacterium HGW-Wallbacteria-1]|jgi:hypothetical protein|uniref:DUF4175 domain-containing protein n=1 Tax=Candidatus Wallbacteria bacterium HGW-Wallbacteria-1 TaxID=2013854 RepID=A0A2N1PVJ5_9BACT|nr:MAG: hypothetical protein CVV64_02595 [Candidatus Wallbacteria bacterium HGW-Wallbacteria-1]
MENIVSRETIKRGQNLVIRVEGQASRFRILLCLKGVIAFLKTLAVGASALWIVDVFFSPEPGVRLFLSWTFLAILAAFGAVRIAIPLASKASPLSTALQIEKAFPQNNRLSSALEYHFLMRSPAAIDEGISVSAMSLAVDDAFQFNENLDFVKSEATIRDNLGTASLGIIWSFFLMAIILFPSEAQYTLARFQNPMDESIGISRRSYKVLPGDTTLVRGQDLEITVSCLGLLPYSSSLQLIWPAGVTQEIPIPVQRTSGTFGVDGVFIHRVQIPGNELRYRIVDEDGPRVTYRARVMERPAISSIRVKYTYPEYTGLKAELVENGSGDVAVLAGSRVWVEATFNKDIKSVKPQFTEAVAWDLKTPEASMAILSFTVVRDNSYSFRLYDGEGLFNDPVRSFSVRCIQDKPPMVEILSPGRDMDMPEDYLVPLRIRAEDDFGISTVRIMVSLRGDTFKAHEVNLSDGSRTVQDLLHEMDFSLEDVGPEDYVLYYASVLDNNTFSGPAEGKSRTFSIRIPSVFEYYQELETDQEYQQQELEKILSEQQEIRQKTTELAERVAQNREMKWEDSRNLENLKQKQSELANRAEKVQEEMKQNMDKMEKNDLISPEAMEKMRQIQEIFSEVADQDLRKLMEEMSKISEKMKVSEQEKNLFKSSFDQKEFEKRLERTLELFKKLRQEQRLEALTRETEKMLAMQEKLQKEKDELASRQDGTRQEWEAMAEKQKKMSAQAEALNKAIKEMAQELSDQGEAGELASQAAGSMDEEEVAGSMQNAADKLRQADSNAASKPMKQSQKGLKKTLSALKKAAKSLKGSNKSALEKKLSEVINETLNLSIRLASVLNDSANLVRVPVNAREKGARTGEEVQELLPIGARIMDSVGSMSAMTFLIDNETVAAGARVLKCVTALRDGLSAGRWHLTASLSRQSMAAGNILCAKLMSIKSQVSSQDSGLGFEQFMEKLKSMLNKQKQMGNKMQMMSGQPESGMSPMMSQLRQEAMQKMAAEQAMIRQSMEEMSRNMGDQGRLSQQMREIASQMGELEKQMRSGDLGKKAMERQQQLTERMLEATKSLNTRKMSKKRESKSGSFAGTATDPGALPEMDGPPRDVRPVKPLKRVELPLEFADIVKFYFEALSVKGGIHGGEK